jgi:hypothetical protein
VVIRHKKHTFQFTDTADCIPSPTLLDATQHHTLITTTRHTHTHSLTRFELSFPRTDDEHPDVRLRSTTNHVGNVVGVSGSVEEGVSLVRRVEVRTAHLHGFALVALFLVGVHDKRDVPAGVCVCVLQ